ncbi:MAG: Uncharacterised protein [Euryarchaeota archaeon UBA443]|nr:MAG: Uncharacterised protein [Euryarchaeota archaeon UBA443]
MATWEHVSYIITYYKIYRNQYGSSKVIQKFGNLIVIYDYFMLLYIYI